jgi:hypothetical protein
VTSKPAPQTLARIGGLSPLPSPPERSVLLMIDPQREYTTGLPPLQDIDAAVGRARACRRSPAALELPHPFGAGVTPAEIIQAGTLAALSDRFFVLIQDTGALSTAASRAP